MRQEGLNMIKEKELNNDLETMKANRNYPSLEEARDVILNIARENQIAIEITLDTVKTKGFFNSQEFPCLVLTHPDHKKDYYKIVILVGSGEIMTGSAGVSKQMKKFNIAEANKQMRKGKSMSFKVGNIIGSSIHTIGKNKEKLAQENEYYELLFGIIGACFEVAD